MITWNPKIASALRRGWPILAVVCLAFAVRLYFAFTTELPPENFEMQNTAARAVEMKFDQNTAPLYPLFLRTAYSIFGEYNHTAVFVLQAFVGALTVLLVVYVARRMCSFGAAIVAGLLCSIYPVFLIYDVSILPESFLVLFTVSILATVSSDASDGNKAVILGALAGLGILFKPVFLFFAPGLFVTAKRRLILLLTLLAVLVPWTVRNAVVYRRIFPLYSAGVFMVNTSKYTNVEDGLVTLDKLYMNASVILRKDWDDANLPLLIDDALSNRKMVRYSFIPVMILGIIGMIRHYRKEHRIVMLPVFIYLALIILLSVVKHRYRLLFEPALIIYTAMLLTGGTCESGAVYQRSVARAQP